MTVYRLDPREFPYLAASTVCWELHPVNQIGNTVNIRQIGHLSFDGGPVDLLTERRWLIPVQDARTTDPATAHHAAAMHTDNVKRTSHRLVLTLLSKCGPLTDHELAFHASNETGRKIGHDSVGKRRLEVQRMGFVERADLTRPTPSGAQAQVWQITTAGKRELANWTVAA